MFDYCHKRSECEASSIEEASYKTSPSMYGVWMIVKVLMRQVVV